MFCKKCGKQIGDHMVVCVDCGGESVVRAPRKMPLLLKILIIAVISIPILAFFAGMLLPALNSAREKARRISCCSNLKQISLSLKRYAMDYHDSFPEKNGWQGLEQLRAGNYLSDPKVYTCPSTNNVSTRFQPLEWESCSYIYFGGFKDDYSSKGGLPNTPIVFDNPRNHHSFVNVAFRDGHVQGFIVRHVENSTELINFLDKRFNYPPELKKQLLEKANQLDEMYGLK